MKTCRALPRLVAPLFHILLLGCGSGGAKTAPTESAPPPNETGARFVGRADFSDPAAPRFAWSGTGFVAKLVGSSLSVSLRSDGGSDPVFYQPVIDGELGERFSVAASEGAKTVMLGSGLADGEHVVEVYRETEGKRGFAYSTFLGFPDGTLADPPPESGRLIEVIGDSISAGYGNLGSEEHPDYGADPNGGCRFSNETESAYFTYGMIAGRAVGADVSIIAASGWGIYSDNQGNTKNVLPSIYGNTVGGQPEHAWRFSPRPQAVVINLGTNDFSADMNLTEEAFATPFRAFLGAIRTRYPDVRIYCAIGPLLYSTGLTNARAYINGVVKKVNDPKIEVLDFGQQNILLGTGCDYHPNVAEHQRMADLLIAELHADLGW